MLNTDLHSRNIKPEKKMRLEQFIKNLRGKKKKGNMQFDRTFFLLLVYIVNVEFSSQCKYTQYGT
jgi:hypothetical protein